MPRVKLGDVAREYKATVKDNAGFPIVGLEHLSPGEITLDCWDTDVETTFTKSFKKGHMLFGRRRAYLKKAALAPFDGVCSGDIIVIEAIPGKINPELLPFIIQNDLLFDYAVGNSSGSLSPRVKWESLKEYEFELPEISKQAELVDLLAAAYNTRKAYQQLIIACDELVKSQFIELFGDPESNPKEWSRCCLKDVMSAPASNGFFAKPADYSDDGNAGIICVGDVVNRKYSNIEHLRRANADDKQFNKFRVKYGDMLFCRSSLVKEGIAKASIIPQDCPDDLLFECHVIRIPLDLDKVIPEFMQAFSVTDFFRGQMMDKSKTATMTTIGQKDVITGVIYVPPMDLQKRFVAFSQQLDKSKFELKQAIANVSELMKSLIQQDFTN